MRNMVLIRKVAVDVSWRQSALELCKRVYEAMTLELLVWTICTNRSCSNPSFYWRPQGDGTTEILST